MKLFFSIILVGWLMPNASAQTQDKLIRDNASVRFYYKLAKKKPGEKTPYRTDTMLLDIGTEMSRFYDPGRLSRDSAVFSRLNPADKGSVTGVKVFKGDTYKEVPNMQGTVSSNATEGESYQIIKGKKGKLTVLDYPSHMSAKLILEEDLGKLNWQLREGTDTITGYVCQKAALRFRGRNYTAWFTPDIPINDGPWKFSGLPGLILKIQDADQLYSFTLIGMTPLREPVPIVIDKADYLKVTREDYNKQMQKKSMGLYVNFTNGIVSFAEIPGKLEYISMELE